MAKNRSSVQPGLNSTSTAIELEFMALFEAWVIDRAQNKRAMMPSSIASYRTRARRIARFLGEQETKLKDVTLGLLEQLVDTLPPASPNRARYLDLVDELLGLVAKQTGTEHNRIANTCRYQGRYATALKRNNNPNPKVLSPSAKQTFVTWFQKPMVGDALELRDRVLCAVMLGAGLKTTEALTLKVGALHFDTDADRKRYKAWKITVPGSGNYPPRDTPLAEYAQYCLSEWMRIGKSMGLLWDDDAFLFPNERDGGPMDKSRFHHRWKDILGQLGLVGYSPHALRNTWAVSNLAQLPEAQQDKIRVFLGLTRKESMEPLMRVMTEKFKVI